MMQGDREEPLERYFEGDLRFEDLPPAVRSEEGKLVQLLGQLADEAEAPLSLRRSVMARIDRLPRSRWEDLVAWYLQPREIRLSPAFASLAAVLVTAAYFVLHAAGWGSGASSNDATTDHVVTRFVFVAPEASAVAVTGDWIGWDAGQLPLEELRGTGVWTADIPVPPGVHEYSFVVDGSEWRPDPLAASQVDDGFGRTNSVLMVAKTKV